MSIRRLKTLISIAERGTFAGAAEVMLISQAAVSQQMKALEDELQVALFDRSKRSPRLNPTGRALVPKARAVVEAYEGMTDTLAGDGHVAGELTLGAVPTTMTGLVPRVTARLRAASPGLRLRIVPGLSAELLAQVDRGYLDAAITTRPGFVPEHLDWRAFAAEPFVLLAPADSPSDDPEELLRGQPYLRFTRRAWMGNQIDEWLQRRRIQVQESMELDTLESIATMVFNGLGVSIVPKPCVPGPRPLPLKQLPLDPSAGARILGLVSRRDTAKARPITVLFDELVALVDATGEVEVVREAVR